MLYNMVPCKNISKCQCLNFGVQECMGLKTEITTNGNSGTDPIEDFSGQREQFSLIPHSCGSPFVPHAATSLFALGLPF